jgi:hypothetical protein
MKRTEPIQFKFNEQRVEESQIIEVKNMAESVAEGIMKENDMIDSVASLFNVEYDEAKEWLKNNHKFIQRIRIVNGRIFDTK